MPLIGLIFLLYGTSTLAQEVPEVAKLLQEVIRQDTSNPPGNEDRVAQLLAPKFRALGFEVDILPTPVAGKTHFVARLRGNGSKKPVLIAAHADVVGVEREKWTVDPFAGIVKDGYVFGRGAIDFKGGLAVFAQAAIEIAREKHKLSRDIIFLSEADEEGGLYPTRYLAEKFWDKIDCEFALNEGGWIIKDDDGKVLYTSISTNDKGSLSLTLTARGTSTHSSMPRPDNAIFTLARALTKLSEYEFKPKLTDSNKKFFMALAETSKEPLKTHFRNLVENKDPALVAAADKAISENVLLKAIMRNTIAPVLLNAGFRGNVIPGSAEATINFRVIPGTTEDELIEEMKKVIQDPRVEVSTSNFTPSRAQMDPQTRREWLRRARGYADSPMSGELYDAIVRNSQKTYPGAIVTPYLFQAGTDAYAWRSKGIAVYGIYPYPITAQDLTRMHGNDERVPIDSLVSGVKLVKGILLDVAK
jgi:acetylornithine deacetylase/succinyl-diaminopimelate desuccinylase-like protein